MKAKTFAIDIDGVICLTKKSDYRESKPNFSAIKAEHFKPAFDIVLKDHKTLITSIASNSDAPTFDNTIKELDKSYIIKSKISSVFSNLCSSLNSPELQLVQAEMAPLLAMHHSSVYMEPNLFDRVNTVFIKRESLGLSSEEIRLTERYHLDFVRAGASIGGSQDVSPLSLL